MPLFGKPSTKGGKRAKLQRKIDQAKEALEDQKVAEQAEHELRSVVEKQQGALRRLRDDVPELKKQLQLAKKVNDEAKKEAEKVARRAVKAISKDPTAKIQKALETQYLAGQEMEKAMLTKEGNGKHISDQSQPHPPPYPEGQIATAFTAALYPSLHTEEETYTEKAEPQNAGPPTAVDNTRAALDRLGATIQEVQSDLQRRIDQIRNPTTPKGPANTTT